MPNNLIIPSSRGFEDPTIDPYYDKVVFQATFNGLAGTNDFSGVDKKNHAMSLIGSPVYSSAQSVIGGSSMYCNQAGLTLTNAPSPDFRFGTGDFTQEILVYMTVYSSVAAFIGNGNSSGNTGLIFYANASGALVLSTGSNIQGSSAPTGMPLNQWVFASCSRVSGVVYIHVNGQLVAQFNSSADVQDGIMNLGYSPVGYTIQPAYIQQARVTKGVGRYGASNYVPSYFN